jgi:hypothetical protein
VIPVELNSHLFELEERPAVLSIARDITQRKRTQRRLEALNECFLTLGADPFANIRLLVERGREILDGAVMKYLRTSNGEQSHRYPWQLPGGEFLYSCIGAADVVGIYWHPKGDGRARRILPNQSRASSTNADTSTGCMTNCRAALIWQRESSRELAPVMKGSADEQMWGDSWFTVSPTAWSHRAGCAAYGARLLTERRRGGCDDAPGA